MPRFKQGIQYAAASQHCNCCLWNTGRPVKPYEIHTSSLSLQPRSIALRDCNPCIITMGPGLP